jgi:gas vesicle protein
MKRGDLTRIGAAAFVLATAAIAHGQERLPIVSIIESARSTAEQDLKQIHTLAKYPDPSASATPIDLASIDAKYDALAKGMNGWTSSMLMAVKSGKSIDSAALTSQGKAVLQQAQEFDATVTSLRKASNASGHSRGFPFVSLEQTLAQVLSDHSPALQDTVDVLDKATAEQRADAIVQLQSAQWKDATAVSEAVP